MMHGYGWQTNGYCGYGLGYFSIWHILFVAGVILTVTSLIIILIKRTNTSDPLESLKMLYVKGDITEEEYIQRKNVIERN